VTSAHAAWERQLETAYRDARERQLARLAEARRVEEERKREEARRALVEARREAITARAREMGYTVREERRGEEIQLVLVRRTY
jgi:predicted Holliday junction resolvase-like endonuclease